MKLYLSSFRLGNKTSELSAMFENKKVGLISNALDAYTDLGRRLESTQREFAELRSVGLTPEDINLKNYFGKSDELKQKLAEFGGIWLRGGNAFVLRRAMNYSGLDIIIKNLVSDKSFVYAGYSAGVCVITPTLKGLELVDDASIVPDGYKSEVIWDGLGLVNYSVAPHYHSDHPETELIEKSVNYFIENKMLFKALKDGEVLIDEINSR